MSEENQDANVGVADPSAQPTPEAGNASTPDAANASQDQNTGNRVTEPTPFHEHPRFKELINEKNQLRQEIAALQARMTGVVEKREDPVERVVQKYVKAGMTEAAARALAEGVSELASARTEERVAPLERETLESQSNQWFAQFAREHKDYEDLKPQMNELFQSLPERMKMGISADPKGIEMLYNQVKATSIDDGIKKAFEKGVQEGYKRKSEKSALAPSGGADAGSPNVSFSDESINRMSASEYQKNLPAILKARGMR